MKAFRREFSVPIEVEIIRRATDANGRIHCEGCGIWLKSRKDYEIDHVVAEGVRPAWRKTKKLTAADGQLLCKAACHRAKTGRDVGEIAKAKRLEAKRPPASGEPEIMRRYKGGGE